MSSLKRRRIGAPSAFVLAPTISRKKRRTFRTGRTRVAGNFGRYNRGGELKYFDVTHAENNIPTQGAIYNTIIGISQGVGENERVGRKCTIRSIHWRYNVKVSESTAEGTPKNGDTVRVIMFLDKQTNGTAALVSDILSSSNYHSFRNLSNSGRFNILYDKQHCLNVDGLAVNTAGTAYSNTEVIREFVVNKKVNIPVEFSNTTGVLTGIKSNNIGILTISKNGDINMNARYRLRFSDN